MPNGVIDPSKPQDIPDKVEQDAIVDSDLTKATIVNNVAKTEVKMENGAAFANDAWKLAKDNTCSIEFPWDDASVDTEQFKPVCLSLKCALVADVTKVTFTMIANKLKVYKDWPIEKLVDPKTSDQSTTSLQMFVPKQVFRGQTVNTISITVNSGELLLKSLTVGLVKNVGEADIGVVVETLKSLMAQLGNEHADVINSMNKMVELTTQTKPEDQMNDNEKKMLAIHKQCVDRKADFTGDNGLDKAMTQLAIKLKNFCNGYGTIFIPTLAKPETTPQQKLTLVQAYQKMAGENETFVQALLQRVQKFKSDMLSLSVDIRKLVEVLDTADKAELDTVKNQITALDLEIKALDMKITATGIGLGVGLFVGVVGIALCGAFPVAGAIVLVIGLIGSAVSLGFLASYLVQRNDKNNERSKKVQRKKELEAKIEANKKLIETLNAVSGQAVSIEQYVNGISSMWSFLKLQLEDLENAFKTVVDGAAGDADMLAITFTITENNKMIAPYFNRMGDVLDSYLAAFPA